MNKRWIDEFIIGHRIVAQLITGLIRHWFFSIDPCTFCRYFATDEANSNPAHCKELIEQNGNTHKLSGWPVLSLCSVKGTLGFLEGFFLSLN